MKEPMLEASAVHKGLTFKSIVLKTLFLVFVAGSVSGGASMPDLEKHKVKAWKKGAFMKPGMDWSEPGFETVIRDHIFFSKEAANGRPSMSGGGCGCN